MQESLYTSYNMLHTLFAIGQGKQKQDFCSSML